MFGRGRRPAPRRLDPPADWLAQFLELTNASSEDALAAYKKHKGALPAAVDEYFEQMEEEGPTPAAVANIPDGVSGAFIKLIVLRDRVELACDRLKIYLSFGLLLIKIHRRHLLCMSNASKWPSVMEEYKGAAESICIAPELMCKSGIDDAIVGLRARAAVSSHAGASLDQLVEALVCKAYRLPLANQARGYYVNTQTASGNVWSSVTQFAYGIPRWQQPIFMSAMWDLADMDSEDGLSLMLELIVNSRSQCDARKRSTFTDIVKRSAVVYKNYTAKQVAEPVIGVSTDDVEDRWKMAAQSVYASCVDAVDDLKERAFRTIFLEPTMLYFRMTRNGCMEGDTEVHGSNSYLALLLSTLHVRLPRTPFLHDESKGIVDFMADTGLAQPLEELWRKENFGKSWSSIPKVKRWEESKRGSFRGSVTANIFVFGRQFPSACELANFALDQSKSAATRIKLAAYLERFAYYFSEPFVLERLLQTLTQDETTKAALDVVCLGLRRRHPDWFAADDTEASCYSYIYDQDTYAFNNINARRLLASIGVAIAREEDESG